MLDLLLKGICTLSTVIDYVSRELITIKASLLFEVNQKEQDLALQ